jgi:hypothetical protein
MRKASTFAALLAASLFAVACDKGPAEMALKAADAAIAGVKPQAEKLVPEAFAALEGEATKAHELFNKGDYKAAGEAAKALAPKAQEVLAAAMSKKDELTKAFADMQGTMPGMVEALTKKLADLKGKASKGMDKAAFDAAGASIGGLGQRWTEITGAFQGGDIVGAMNKARALKTDVEGLMSQFGVAAPAAAPAPAEAH